MRRFNNDLTIIIDHESAEARLQTGPQYPTILQDIAGSIRRNWFLDLADYYYFLFFLGGP